MRQISTEIATEYDGYCGRESLAAAIDEAIDAAVKEEREACAKIVDDFVFGAPEGGLGHFIGKTLAEKIRQRGQS